MKILLEALKSTPIAYVTRDIERAIGLNPQTEGYFIISNSTPFAKQVAKNRTNILLIEENRQLDTWELLKHPKVINFIEKINLPLIEGDDASRASAEGVSKKTKGASILVFKNTKQIEKICAEFDWPLLNPSSELASSIEEKLLQVNTLKNISDLFPEYKILECQNIKWTGSPFILQFNHSHTGTGTILINSADKLASIKEKFPDRGARVVKFIKGAVFTNNNIVSKSDILMGNISYQITGLPTFTDRPFATIGNDWGLAKKLLSKDHSEYFKVIVKSVGEELHQLGWKGLFGIDVILEQDTGKMYLIEINARQPASTAFESILQTDTNTDGTTIFEAHLAELLKINSYPKDIIRINDGAQIIQRIIQNKKINCSVQSISADLNRMGFTSIEYKNKNTGAELLRIQSKKSIMASDNKLNRLGETIEKILLSNSKALSEPALKVIEKYIDLNCPYFNNLRIQTRGGLPVFTGKGSPKDIIEEISIIEKKERANIKLLSKENKKKFLVDHNIGIDCSGFVYHVLDAELKSKNLGSLKSKIFFPFIKNPLRKLITKLRAAQNTNTAILNHSQNSYSIKLMDIMPGDMIVMMRSGEKNDRDHILVVEKVDFVYSECDIDKKGLNPPKTVHYAHSFAWSIDGKYNHGVRRGQIEITDIDADLLNQNWTEQEKTGMENETFKHARQAKILDIRRLNVLQVHSQ